LLLWLLLLLLLLLVLLRIADVVEVAVVLMYGNEDEFMAVMMWSFLVQGWQLALVILSVVRA